MRFPDLGNGGGVAAEHSGGGRGRAAAAWRAGALVVMLGLVACAPGPAQAPASAGPERSAAPAAAAPAAAPTAVEPPLHVVANWTAPTHAMTPFWVAQDTGVFREQGLDVELLNVPGTSQVLQTMIAGEMNLSPLDPASTVQADLAGADIVLLLSMHNRLPFSIVTQPTIRDPEGLRGGTSIGVTRIGSSSHTAALVALRSWGLVPERDVAFRLLGTTPGIYAALEAGQIDAAVATLPLPPSVREGYTELINLATNGPEYPSVAIGGPRSWIAANEEATRRFLRAYVVARDRAKADKSLALAAFRKYMQLDDPAQLDDTYATYLSMYEPLPYVSEAGFARVLEDLAVEEPRAAGHRPAEYIDSKYTHELETAGYFQRGS